MNPRTLNHLAVALLLALASPGCGAAAVPGGVSDWQFTRASDGSYRAAVTNSGDRKFSSLKVTLPDGIAVDAEGVDINGSNLGAMQLAAFNSAMASLSHITDTVASLIPLLGKGIVTVPTTAPVVSPPTQPADTPQQAADRAYLTQRAQACPFLAQAGTTASVVAAIQSCPASMLGTFRQLLDGYLPVK